VSNFLFLFVLICLTVKWKLTLLKKMNVGDVAEVMIVRWLKFLLCSCWHSCLLSAQYYCKYAWAHPVSGFGSLVLVSAHMLVFFVDCCLAFCIVLSFTFKLLVSSHWSVEKTEREMLHLRYCYLAFCMLCTVWVKKKSPPTVFWNFFPNGWEFLINFLHTYYTITSTPEYKILFKYLQLWQSYAILSATT